MSDIAPGRQFAQSMREIRKARGLSVQNLADLCDGGVVRTTISDAELGRGPSVRIDHAVAISEALGVNLLHMLDGTAPQRAELGDRLADLEEEKLRLVSALGAVDSEIEQVQSAIDAIG